MIRIKKHIASLGLVGPPGIDHLENDRPGWKAFGLSERATVGFSRHLARLLLGVLFCGWNASAVAQPLDTLTHRLWETHPELRALDFAYRAERQRGAQVAQRPDPEVLLGYFLLPVETRTGPQRVRLGATQRLPWPGRLDAQAALAAAQAGPLVEQRGARVLDLALALRTAYFDAWLYQNKATQLQTFLPIYSLLEQRVLARIESGSGSTVSAYQLALEQQQLNYRIEALQARLALPEATIGGLLQGRVELPLDYVLADATLDTARIGLLRNALSTTHPRLRLYDEQRKIRRAALAANEYALKPDFAVGLDYILVNERADADPGGNGRDILGPRVGVRLPLDKGAYHAKREEETLRLLRIDASATATLLDLQTQIDRRLASYRLAELKSNFLQQQLATLPPALDVARAEYAEGRRPLEEVLRLEERLLNYRLDLLDNRHARATLRAQLANLLAVHPDQISNYE